MYAANCVRGPVGDEETGAAVVDDREQTADRARHDRRAARRRLQGDQAEALRALRDEHDVGGPVVGRQDVVLLRRDEPDLVVEAERVDEGVHAFDLVVAGLSRSPRRR